jgi:Domain of unknown function (DUF4360)
MKTQKSVRLERECGAKLTSASRMGAGKWSKTAAAVALVIPMVLGSVSTFAAAQNIIWGPRAPQIDLSRAILAGSGCSLREDSLSTIGSTVGTVIGLGFSRMSLAQVGRVSCVLRIPLSVPAGYKAIISGGEANGFADLNAGDSVTIASRLTLFGIGASFANEPIRGPINDSFGPSSSGLSVFHSRYRASTGCMSQPSAGFIGLNIAASAFPRLSGEFTITDAAIGVQLVRCP